MLAAHLVLLALSHGRQEAPKTPIEQRSTLHAEPLESPARAGSRCPRLSTSSTGDVYLSWIEEGPGSDSTSAMLLFARLKGTHWSSSQEIARGDRWFVNWADFPSLAVFEEEHLFAHFLQMSAEGKYDYHVQIARSADRGTTWSSPQRLHDDSGSGEHGFVSLVPHSKANCTAVWLDGRNTKGHAEGAGAMSLYARTLGSDGSSGSEVLLDARVCDCCPTSAVALSDGSVLVAYRDRSSEEVRDISVIRIADGKVSSSTWSSRDGWKVAGCPVNGPVLAVRGESVALVWFTFGSDTQARVLCAFSSDGGRSFGLPMRLAGTRAHGRVDATFDEAGRLLVTWLEADAAGAEWRIAHVDPTGHAPDSHSVVETTSLRESGLARIAVADSGVIFTWTQTEPSRRVALQRLTWE